jgi:hypothetical protein
MKKLLLLLFFSFVLATVYGQFANNSFESWNSTPYDEPIGWETGNRESVSIGMIPVTKITGVSGFGVRMETLVNNGDTASAYITNGDPMSGSGGIPFAEQPTAITGQYRYSLPVNDTAIILVLFKNNGIIISQDIFKIKGSGIQNTFTSFSFPLSLTSMPDSVVIAATCSNLIDNIGIEDGSFLELDAIAFTGAVTPIPNSAFENWTTFSNDAIIGWETYGNGVTKTNDSYDGNSAISLTTYDYGNGNIYNSGMTNGQLSQNGTIGGSPYTMISDTLTGYYKYSGSTSDSASIYVSILKNSNNISGNVIYLPVQNQYTYFEIPLYSGITPDTIRLDISSSKYPYTPTAGGSTLIIDNLRFKSELTAGVNENPARKNIFTYPNPVSDVLNIRLANTIEENVMIEIYDLSGRLVVSGRKQISDSVVSINIESLNSGMYFCKLNTSKGMYQQSFTKQ